MSAWVPGSAPKHIVLLLGDYPPAPAGASPQEADTVAVPNAHTTHGFSIWPFMASVFRAVLLFESF